LYDADRHNDGISRSNLSTGSALISPQRDAHEGEYVLSLSDLLKVIWRRMWVVALTALVIAGAVLAYNLLVQTPKYEASIKILIGQESGANQQPSSLGGEVQGLQDITLTMAQAVNTRSVAEAVIKRLHLSMAPEDLLQDLNAKQIPSTQFIEVSYRDPDPETAQKVANSIGDEFSKKISKISPSAVTATVWESAVAPQEPVSPKPLRNGLLALMLGTILGIGLAFLVEQLDDSWRSPEEVEQVSGVPTFGVVPEFKVPKDKSLEEGLA
jgi:capsular polysaccharide biosynthesis protein